ncbi:DUF3089 domain-containing protein [Orrella marina]|uniref:DUF3089 domain-containing protein n=1 Tax=Orrella marina TaxID=2163011 RepID=A0A2R4XIM2_9BURK|nr:DUF3089 domain-containing protein [Orrella marina]AWB33648.1 DUF3089 domain-containing protein [Orrella marina]
MKSLTRTLLAGIPILLATGIIAQDVQAGAAQAGDAPKAPDYGMENAWLAKPSTVDKPVDVFYVYPTIYADIEPENMDISDPALRANAAGLLKAQASVYSEHANLFAPFYRQQSGATQSMMAGNDGNDPFQDPRFQVGAQDVAAAFEYYLEHLNNNRPFLLAGHSQGSMALIQLMRERFDDEELQKRLIAAYLIGYSVPSKELSTYPWMKPAKGETDNDVIISYNTEGPGAGASPVLYPGKVVVINPLNWETDATVAGPEHNLGARFFNDATGELIEEIPQFTGAYIDQNKSVLVVTDMKTPTSDRIDLVNLGRWSHGVFHRFDYAFFFNNLAENVRKRINSYIDKQQR